MFGILAVGILMLVFIVNVMHNQSNLIMTDDTCEFGYIGNRKINMQLQNKLAIAN